jgi:hypothetical protein
MEATCEVAVAGELIAPGMLGIGIGIGRGAGGGKAEPGVPELLAADSAPALFIVSTLDLRAALATLTGTPVNCVM